MPGFDKQFIFNNFYLVLYGLIIPLILKTIFRILLVLIYFTLNVKPLKQCMYFWIHSISCPKLTSLYINYTTNGFVPVVQERILDIMLPKRTSSPREYFLVESLVYFSSINPRFATLFYSNIPRTGWKFITRAGGHKLDRREVGVWKYVCMRINAFVINRVENHSK